jgi:phosphoglucosamine mutase
VRRLRQWRGLQGGAGCALGARRGCNHHRRVKPDGFNINKDCGSTSTDALSDKVHEVRADIGIALDGDADRVIIVDENGRRDGDQLMAVVAQSWQADDRLAGRASLRLSCPILAWSAIWGLGLGLVRTKVGDRYVVEHMRANGYNVGGEQSGHIVLSDFATTGDGLIAALQIMACIKQQDKPVSEVCRRFEPVPQILKNVRYKGGAPLQHSEVKSAIEDGEARLGTSGRLVIRASGTEPLIRVMAEGDDADLVKQVVNDIAGVVASSAA